MVDEMDEIKAWFFERGFVLRVWRGVGRSFWADLTRLPSDKVVAARYGTGDTELGAVRRAKERFEQEQ